MHSMNGFMTGMGWYWIIGLIGITLFVWILMNTFNREKSEEHPGGKSAMDILRERYASGEIRKEEFMEKKSELSK